MEKKLQKSQRIVPLAFLFILVLVSTAMAISFHTISTMRQGMASIINNYSAETELVQSLQVVVQQRMTIIRELLLEDDIFKRDEKFQAFNRLGRRYNTIVGELNTLALDSREHHHLQELQRYVHDSVELRQAIRDMVFEQGDVDKNYILQVSNDTQEKYQFSLAALLGLYKAETEHEWLLADNRYQNWLYLLWIFAAGILFTSSYIAYRTSRYIRQYNIRLDAMAREKSMLLATMSHEIRTPLTSVIGFSETLLDTDTTKEERIAGINAIVRNSRHLQQVINDVLDYSKLDAKQVALHNSRVELRILIDDLCSLLRPRAESKGIEFVIEAKNSLPEFIITDEIKLKQVLINLVGNAIKFTEQGKVELHLVFLEERSMLSLEVIDSGIGMSDEDLTHIFEPYRQVGEQREIMGTGLGLYISKQMVYMMGGSLAVQSQPAIGSCFSVLMPVGDISGFARIQWSGEMVEQVQGALNRAIQLSGNVLLAEDREDNQHLFSMYMNKAGVNLTIVDNGKDALEEALQGDYSLVLMDMQMPVMDGLSAVKTLREQGYTKPVLALTANTDSDVKHECEAAGFDDFLTKPISRGSFLQVITRYLQNNSGCIEADQTPITSTLTDDELRPALDYFVGHLPEQYSRMQQTATTGNWLGLKQDIHDIKGTAGGVGFPMLTRLATELEFAIAKQDEQEVLYLLQLMGSQIKRIQRGHTITPAQVEVDS
ncbi:MAG: ATP-binding protein [Gammaproteobacteria bacterium]|nr:ATP-binding protein [Gammaproteobacteria bacterium]